MKIKFKSIFENEQKKTFDKIDPWDKNLCLWYLNLNYVEWISLLKFACFSTDEIKDWELFKLDFVLVKKFNYIL
jgi:hypothetical protein